MEENYDYGYFIHEPIQKEQREKKNQTNK